jgi:hypothetical protein
MQTKAPTIEKQGAVLQQQAENNCAPANSESEDLPPMVEFGAYRYTRNPLRRSDNSSIPGMQSTVQSMWCSRRMAGSNRPCK